MKAIIKYCVYIYAALLPLLLSGCKLDKPDYSEFELTANSYQPVTQGSYWVYRDLVNGSPDTVTTTVTGNSFLLNQRTYYEENSVSNSAVIPNQTAYVSSNNHIYTQLTQALGDTVELYYYNDTTAVNGTWTSPINSSGAVNGVPGRFAGQIVEKGTSRTVNGTTFNNVVHTRIYQQNESGSAYVTVITYDYFLVKGVGIIEIDKSGSGDTEDETLLKYSLK